MFEIDPFTIALAAGPLAAYLLLIGVVNLSRRPLITTGAQDTIALAIGTSGLLLTGPLNLFFPTSAYSMLGGIVWAMLALFYSLVLLLIVLSMRPRLVVYGSSGEQVRHALLRAARTLDPDARAEGEQVWMPQLRTGVRVESFTPADIPQVVPQTHAVSPTLWRKLAAALRKEMSAETNGVPHRGAIFLIAAAILLSLILVKTYNQPAEVVEGFKRWLRI